MKLRRERATRASGTARRWRATAVILAALAAVYIVVQFYRVAVSVIAPDMMRELALTSEAVGGLTAAFFVGLALAQIPVGMLVDRIGPRITMPAMLGFAVLGSLLFAAATSTVELTMARLLTGVGCAGAIGAMVVCARWFAPKHFGTLAGVLAGLGNLGNLLAATPLAAAAQAFGWRAPFVAVAFITAVVAVIVFAMVRDTRPGREPEVRVPESGAVILAGLAQVILNRRLHPIVAMSFVGYASLITVMGLWAGPYLHDVHGLGPVPRGNVQLVMTLGLIAALFAIGPIERYFDTRKGVVVWGAAATIAVFGVLALWPSPPLWAVTVLFALLAPLNAYSIIAFAHGRAMIPDRLVGRGIAVLSVISMCGIATLQITTGFIVGAFAEDGVVGPAGYRWMFAFLAAIVLASLLRYRRSEDMRPSRDRARAGA